MDTIPPLTRPEDMPPVRSQTDLHRMWRALMGPLGFGGRSLWLAVLDEHGRPTPRLLQVDEMPPRPDPAMQASLVRFVASMAEGARQVVFLVSRPGSDGLTDDDVAWASTLQTVAREAGIPVWPVHRANDRTLLVVTPDDLSALA